MKQQRMLELQEPVWWKNLIIKLNLWMNNDPIFKNIVPITADIFVFIYPVFLFVLYVWWIIKNNAKYKQWALFIFFCAIFCVLVNIFIQILAFKARPNFVLEEILDEKNETILHQFLPQWSFPSDHASVSMWIAIATLIIWIKQKNTFLKVIWILFVICSLVMSVSRVSVWVHRPTDVISGTLVWIIVPLIFVNNTIYNFLDKYLFTQLIKFQERVIGN